MRINKYVLLFLSAALIVGFLFFYVNYKVQHNESESKIKLLKELNFKPHKSKLTLNENSETSRNKSESSEFGSEIINYQQRIDEVIYEGFEFSLGETKNDIINNLGEPLKIIEKSITSRLKLDLTDILYDLVYDGIQARIYHATTDEKELVLRIFIENEKYRVKYGLNVGVTEEYVLKVLGSPAFKQKDQYEYYDSNGFAKLRFYFVANILTKIEWNFEEN